MLARYATAGHDARHALYGSVRHYGSMYSAYCRTDVDKTRVFGKRLPLLQARLLLLPP